MNDLGLTFRQQIGNRFAGGNRNRDDRVAVCECGFYSAETRNITFDDAYCATFDINEGDPSTVSITLTVIGPVEIDGVSIIASR